jgi:predicted enzyme related to lactoylglutathione lyase
MKIIVNIDVPELSPAIAFYSAAFGLELSRVLDEDVAELIGGSSTIYLLKKDAGSSAAPSCTETRRYTRHWTPVHVDFVVKDIASAAMRAEKAGAVRESECVEWWGSKCITYSDPFGNGFCLIEFTAETYSASDA